MDEYFSPEPHMHISFVIFFIALGVLLVSVLTMLLYKRVAQPLFQLKA